MAISRIKEGAALTNIQEGQTLIDTKIIRPKYLVDSAENYEAPIYVGGATNASPGASPGPVINLQTELSGGVGTIQEGDIVIAIFGRAAETAGTTDSEDMAIATPGYTELADLFQEDTRETNLGVFYKIMGEIPDSQVEGASLDSGGASLERAEAMIVHVWRNVNRLNPIEAISTVTAASSSLANPPAVTTITENAVVLAIGASANDNNTTQFTQGGDLSNFISIGSPDTQDITLGVGSIATTTPGPVDPLAFSIATNSSYSWAAVTLALRGKLVSENTIVLSTGSYIFNSIYDTEYSSAINLYLNSSEINSTGKTFSYLNFGTNRIDVFKEFVFTTGTINNAVAYDGNNFLGTYTTGSRVLIRTSQDGKSWTESGIVFSSTAGQVSGLAPEIFIDKIDNSYYVRTISSGDPRWSYSTDLVNWSTSEVVSWTSRQLTNVKYLNGRYVGIFDGGNTIYISTDKVNWQSDFESSVNEIYDVSYFKNYYYYTALVSSGSQAGTIRRSTDLLTWTTVLLFATGQILNSLETDGNILVASGKNDLAFSNALFLLNSTDGTTWTTASINYTSSTRINNISYTNNTFFGLNPGSISELIYSYNGINWNKTTLSYTSHVSNSSDVVQGNNKLLFSSPTSTLTLTTNPSPIILNPTNSLIFQIYSV